MAGYLFLFNNFDALSRCARFGIYGTILNPPYWRPHHEGTVADFVTMAPGDNIYLFHNRKIFGIGEITKIDYDCKFLNYPDAGKNVVPKIEDIQDFQLINFEDNSINQRFICIFEPSPSFFVNGVDMDDVLSSNPKAFKMLRALWKKSFIKFDDDENQAFKNILLKRNQEFLIDPNIGTDVFSFDRSIHEKLKKTDLTNYSINRGIKEILRTVTNGTRFKHEMALEMGVLHQISIKDLQTISVLGEWDYLSHQVIASPFKPIDYMDKMDIFGYSFISDHFPTISKYLIIELKKDSISGQDVNQLMRYVDWVHDEYCFGDYSMIKAFLLAFDFEDDVIAQAKEVGVRKYTVGMRPTQSKEWLDIGLVSYSYSELAGRIDLRNEWSSLG